MKLRTRLFASIFSLVALLLTGCHKETGFSFEQGKVNYTSPAGHKQSLEIGPETMVVMNQQADSIALVSQTAKDMFPDWRLTKGHTDLEALDDLLTFSNMSYEFDFTEKRLVWEGKTLKVIRMDADTATLSIPMAEAKGVVLYDNDITDTKVSLAVYGGRACEELEDFDAYLEAEAGKKQTSPSMHLTACDHELVGAFTSPIDGGNTGIIIIVDPAIIDDKLARTFFKGHVLDRELTAWQRTHGVRRGGLPFITLTQNALNPPRIVPDTTTVDTTDDTVTGRCFFDKKTMVVIEEVEGWAEIERCDALFTVMTPKKTVVAEFDCLQCDLEFRFLGDRTAGRTVILADSLCADHVRLPLE